MNVRILFIVCDNFLTVAIFFFFFRVVVRLGSSVLDLDEGLTVVFSEPVGWQVDFFTYSFNCKYHLVWSGE